MIALVLLGKFVRPLLKEFNEQYAECKYEKIGYDECDEPNAYSVELLSLRRKR